MLLRKIRCARCDAAAYYNTRVTFFVEQTGPSCPIAPFGARFSSMYSLSSERGSREWSKTQSLTVASTPQSTNLNSRDGAKILEFYMAVGCSDARGSATVQFRSGKADPGMIALLSVRPSGYGMRVISFSRKWRVSK